MSLDEKKVNAILLLEVLGRPAEYLVETLNSIIKSIGEEKGVKVNKTKINDPVLMKDQKDFYTSFAEIEVDVDEILYLVILMFKYMPAHIEIVSPQNLHLSNFDVGDVLNELTRRLHGYEEIVRMAQAEKNILETKLRELITPKEEVKEEKEKKKISKKKK